MRLVELKTYAFPLNVTTYIIKYFLNVFQIYELSLHNIIIIYLSKATLTASIACIWVVSNIGTDMFSCFINKPISVQPNIIPCAPSCTNSSITLL